MTPKRLPPHDPREWLNRARSNFLAAKRLVKLKDVYPEDVCFNLQQAVEKALKGVLIRIRGKYPKTHNIDQLFTLIIQMGVIIPDAVLRSAELTEYAHALRYPGWHEVPNDEDVVEAFELAESVLSWAKKTVRKRRPNQKSARKRGKPS